MLRRIPENPPRFQSESQSAEQVDEAGGRGGNSIIGREPVFRFWISERRQACTPPAIAEVVYSKMTIDIPSMTRSENARASTPIAFDRKPLERKRKSNPIYLETWKA
jgi:hypothetical protein